MVPPQMVPTELTGKQRRFLRAKGHHLAPIVILGKEGVTQAVGAELDRALLDHELVKVRLLDSCPEDRKKVGAALGAACHAAVAGELGRTLLFYKAHPEKPRLVLPAAGALR